MIKQYVLESPDALGMMLQGGLMGGPITMQKYWTFLDTLKVSFTAPLAMTVTFAAGGSDLTVADITSQIATQTLAAGAQVNAHFDGRRLVLVENVPSAGVALAAVAPGVGTAHVLLGFPIGTAAGKYYNSDFTTVPYYLDVAVLQSGSILLLTEE